MPSQPQRDRKRNSVHMRTSDPSKTSARAWAQSSRQPQSKTSVTGVGRAGAPLRNPSIPGMSRADIARNQMTGTSRVRVSRPGVSGSGRVISRQGKVRSGK